MKIIETTQVFERRPDGNNVLVSTTEREVDEPTQEEIIAEKEAKLLKMYNELEALKANL